ncbi:GNAT family N-acetyltransferase [Xylophilus sp.]|uniref:GNAT family N-acetyltransferase n=1 Tax=Xylophilus sp. TaxID=2653893 RepID=UPI0013B9C893|nr:GNAT family N-acetyltransferase [Xylophilus sp.]KAF1045183.1 MAG: hypothetical protein GAK38_03144 [Xylophilus sp.]
MALLAIRRLRQGDLDALLALYTHLHAQDDPLPARSVVEGVWRELLADARQQCLGGFDGDALVASCKLVVVPNLTRGCRPYALVENVVTHAGHRGQGHGHALLAHALALAWERVLQGDADDRPAGRGRAALLRDRRVRPARQAGLHRPAARAQFVTDRRAGRAYSQRMAWLLSPLFRRLAAVVLAGGAALLAAGCASEGGARSSSDGYGSGSGVEVFGTIDAGVSSHGRSGIR